jgi:ribonuclease J
MIEILPIGGLGEVGKNMTAIGIGGKYIIVDMGVRLDAILNYEDAELGSMSRAELIAINAIPDDAKLRGRDVRAIVLTHGHMDHIGAIGKLANAYDAPIYGTPFTIELTKNLIREERKRKLKNKLKTVAPGGIVEVGDIRLEFIKATHSILQTALIAVSGGDGSVLFASDFKLDDQPLLGERTDYKRLRRLGKRGVLAACVGAIRVDEPGPTPSEAHARNMLREVMEKAADAKGAVLVTTFSSHIVRIKSIVDISFEIGRTPILLGRSLRNYTEAAKKLDLVDFPPELRIHGRGNAVKNVLREVDKFRSDYVLVVTGHQGEPTALLTRIADGQLPFKISQEDEVIFSSSIIPNPINESNRKILETKLKAQGAHIYRNVHVSGHAGRKDTIEFLKMIKAEHLIPCHGTQDKLEAMMDIGYDIGYSDDQLHLLQNGRALKLGG